MPATWGQGLNLRGPKGDVGSAGLSVIQQSGPPASSLSASDGQLYIDTSAYDTYVYSASSSAWTKTGNIRGPIGLNGISGSFFTGVGAPTTATYNGDGQAIYINTVGELYTYQSKAQGWVDSGENLTGPQGVGVAGQRGSQFYSGVGQPSNDLSSFSPPAMARDIYLATDTSTLYILS